VFAVRGDAGDPYLVYAHQVGQETQPGRTYPTLEVVTYDVETHERVAAFEVGGPGENPSQVVAAGDRIIVNLEQRILSYARDGSDERVHATATDDGHFIGIGVSPDGTMLAYTHTESINDPDATDVFVLSIDTGNEVLHLEQRAEEFDGFRGQLALITWRADNQAFEISGYTYTSAPGGLATVFVDGRVAVHDYLRRLLAPAGRTIATGDVVICSLGTHPEQREIVVRDLDSGAVAGVVHAPEGRFVGWYEWSPDGRELRYLEYSFSDEVREGCPVRDESSLTWHLLDIESGSRTPVAGPAAARARWFGDAVLTYYCDSEPVDEPGCFVPGVRQPLEVRVGSTVLEEAVFGFQVVHQPQVFDSPSSRAVAPGANTHRDAELRMSFEYPAGWQFGGGPRPFDGVPCDVCFAPARDVEHPYGVSFYYNDNLSEEEYLGCSISCFAGNRAVAPQRLPDREIEVAGLTAEQIDVGRSPPLGLANETGDHTWYDETWTLIRHEGRILFFVSYHRLGDEEGERETAAALDLMLSTFRFD
jgi:hypothetical protein